MTYHKGDEFAIYGVLRWDDPEGVTYTLDDFDVSIVLKDNYGNVFKTFSSKSDPNVIINAEDNSVARIVTPDITNKMKGRYFAIIELWYGNYKIYTNEVETVYVI